MEGVGQNNNSDRRGYGGGKDCQNDDGNKRICLRMRGGAILSFMRDLGFAQVVLIVQHLMTRSRACGVVDSNKASSSVASPVGAPDSDHSQSWQKVAKTPNCFLASIILMRK